MNRRLKIAVLCLMLLAIPSRGFAAVLMLACAPGHHETTAAAQAEHDHASHGHAQHSSHSSASDENPSGHNDHPASGKCSSCDSCCIAVVMSSSFVAQIWAPPASHVSPNLHHSPFIGFFTDGPERPPRALLS